VLPILEWELTVAGDKLKKKENESKCTLDMQSMTFVAGAADLVD